MCLRLCRIDHWSSTALIVIFLGVREWRQDSSGELEELAQVLEGSLWDQSVVVVDFLGTSRTEGALGRRFLSSWTRHCLVRRRLPYWKDEVQSEEVEIALPKLGQVRLKFWRKADSLSARLQRARFSLIEAGYRDLFAK